MKKLLFIPMLAFALSACGGSQTPNSSTSNALSACGGSQTPNSSTSKYGSNTFITENGTCYVIKKEVILSSFSLVLLKADGTGSASRYYNKEQYSWEFTYVIKNEKDLYFPRFDGESMNFEFSVNSETSLREMKDGSNVWVEYNGLIENSF